jgi:transposase
MPSSSTHSKKKPRRGYSPEFKEQAVQLLVDGHSARSLVERFGLAGPYILYRWRKQLLAPSGPTGQALDARVGQLEEQLRLVERERDILKKALGILGRSS